MSKTIHTEQKNLNLQKRARNPPHDWVKQKKKKKKKRERERKESDETSTPERELIRAKQRESCIDHMHHRPRHHSLRHSDRGLGAETQAPEVSSGEKTRVGWVGTV